MDYLHQLANFIEKIKEMSIVSWVLAIFVGLATSYGTLIGYNNGSNDAINFIAFLVICDFITRIIAQLIKANKTLSKKEKEFTLFWFLRLFMYAHKIKAISSHAFIRGFFIKVISYTILLSIAQFASNTTSVPLVGNISVIIYGGLIIYDIISVCENLSEMQFKQADLLLKIFKRKMKELEKNG